MSDDTDIVEKHPIIDTIVKIVLKRIEILIVSGTIALGGAVWTHNKDTKEGHENLWKEVGPHLMDNMNQVISNMNAVKDLQDRIKLLEQDYAKRNNITSTN